ncbi:MAG: GIY-YIG nuclease family protein [Pseudomonadota bacterium]|nr:GIY-YIG nuclease family protein [Pseudomonadota bacterium]
MKGRSLELFFVDGDPDGMLTAEVFNWTGHVLKLPRAQIAEGLRRTDAQRTGVYALLGMVDERSTVYIGETENLAQRIADHARDKDWWEQAVLITSSDDGLHKAHVRYLEKRMVELAASAEGVALANGNIPGGASLNEAATSNMERFLENLQIVLPAIRVDILSSRRRPSASYEPQEVAEGTSATRFYMSVSKHNIKAQAILRGNEFIVQKGSQCRPEWIGTHAHNEGYAIRHAEFVAKGIINVAGGVGEFTENYAFSSPSAASTAIAGRSDNGRRSWKTESGVSYADWETQQLTKPMP